MSKFYSKIGEIKLGKKGQFAKSRNGEYIFTIGNKMVYTDGRYNNPSINSVVDIIVKSKDANEISTMSAKKPLVAPAKLIYTVKVFYGEGLELMYISEIAERTNVKIYVNIGLERLEFETTTVSVEDKELNKLKARYKFATVYPVKKNDKTVALNPGNGIVYSVQAFNQEEEKMYEWINVRPQMLSLKDGRRFLLLICPDNMKPLNRRDNYRLWLGAEGVATFGLDRTPMDVVVKDISSSGIAFIAKDFKKELLPNSWAHISFFDEDTGTNFNINAIILREEELSDSKTLFGCKMSAESAAVNHFIREKERVNLQKHSNRYSAKHQQDYTS